MGPSSVRWTRLQGDRIGAYKRLWGHPCEDGGRDWRDVATSPAGATTSWKRQEGALRQNTALLMHRFQTSSLRNCEQLNSCCVTGHCIYNDVIVTEALDNAGASGPTAKTRGPAQREKARHILKDTCAYRAQWLPEKRCNSRPQVRPECRFG